MDDLTQQFWRVIASVAATFAGFTLAGYSLYIARAERAAADPVCRQYCFKECTSTKSLYFMLFAIMMFIAPLVLAIIILPPEPHILPSWSRLLWVGGILVIILVVLSVVHQGLYLFRITRYNLQMKKKKISQQAHGKIILHYFLLAVVAAVTLLSTAILFHNVAHILRVLDDSNWLGNHLSPFGNLLHPKPGAVLSLTIGLTLICLYFYIFQPERFLFAIEASTKESLKDAHEQIEKKRESLEGIQKWVLAKLDTSAPLLKMQHATSLDILSERESAQAIQLLSGARTYAEGASGGLFEELPKNRQYKDKTGMIVERLPIELLHEQRMKYHLRSIKFLEGSDFLTYDSIIWIMNGFTLYAEGLNRFETRLKEIPVQLPLLFKTDVAVAMTDVKTENPPAGIITTRRPRNRSKLIEVLKIILG